jgi:hypothetical protein
MNRSSSAPHRRVLRMVAVMLTLLPVLMIWPIGAPSPVGATTSGSLTVYPDSDGKGVRRSQFVFDLEPGAAQRDVVVVSNSGDRPLNVRVYVANSFTTASGKLGVKSKDEPRTGAALWTTFTSQLGNGLIQIAPGTAKKIPFSIYVPPDAPPGDYAVGVAAVPDVDAASADPGSNKVTVVTAVASLVLLRVKGPLLPAATISALEVAVTPPPAPFVRGGRSVISFDVSNIGNQRLNLTVKISQLDAFDRVMYEYPPIELPNVLPGARVKINRAHPDAPLVRGRVKVEMTSTEGTTVTRTQSFWAIPWGFVVAVMLLLVLVRIAWIRRRRRPAATNEPVPPLPPPPPAPAEATASANPEPADTVST